MYKLLLAWRYLRTRFIALASIVSVTLGVATLIVVNSVMAGFIQEMHARLHGILSDVEIGVPGLGEIHDPAAHIAEVHSVLGSQVEAVTTVVRVPALLHYEFLGRPMTQQIMLIGIDDRTFGQVTDFYPYLMNEQHRDRLDFTLKETGYDPKLGTCGWPYRRQRAEMERMYQNSIPAHFGTPQTPADPARFAVTFKPLPKGGDRTANSPSVAADAPDALRQGDPPIAFDPSQEFRRQLTADERFNPIRDQHTGIVLGLAISNRKLKDPDTGETREIFLIRPGDDIQLTMPTAGPQPSPITEICTVVDFYSSNMHEYDSSFAFMPIGQMQALRGMVDPLTRSSSVSAIQIKVTDGADLDQARDVLLARFPPHKFPYIIQTWQDTQRPLLSAVNLELTILNILLFLIIAVAGFGILATFFMIVVEKTKDIGILKSLGAPSHGVMAIFLSYGLSLGTVGTGVGIGLGLLLVFYINDIADLIQRLTGREIFDPTIYYFQEIPTLISPWMVAWVALGAIAIAVLASVLPALRAARLHPVQALRYE